MSGNNPYPRHHGGNNSYNRNATRDDCGNGNDNNYHIRNPYSPHAKKAPQQQLKPPQYNTNQGSNTDSHSRRPLNNPYSQKMQERQPQKQGIPNQYRKYSNTSKLSFAISPESLPRDYRQQQQHALPPAEQQQKQPGNTSNDNNSISQPPTTQQQQPPQQAPQPQPQPPQDDSKILLDKLRDQLDQSNESNFELEASVMALEAELQHTKRTLQEAADREKSKLEHELRLAQQESKRWKLLAQQQPHKGRSIVRDAVPPESAGADVTVPPGLSPSTSGSSSVFSNRLLGDSAGFKPFASPSSSKTPKPKPTRTFEEEFPLEASLEENTTPADDAQGKHQHPPTQEPLQQQQQQRRHFLPVARLARTLLEQLEPTSKSSQTATASNQKAGTEASATIDETSIRKVLLSIASLDNEQPDPKSPLPWTEGTLMEWLIKSFSSETSGRYLSTLLLLSPEARKYVSTTICLDCNKQQHQQQQHFSASFQIEPSRRKRRTRIRPIMLEDGKENKSAKLDEWQQQIRQSLRNPLWNPNDVLSSTPGGNCESHTITKESSSLVIREWVKSLAASRDLRHLHTLRVLLAEEGGRNGFLSTENDGDGQKSEAWWTLCYPSIAVTIQSIIYRKLICSKTKRTKKSTPRVKRLNNPTESNDSNGERRYRTGRFETRLKGLPEAARAVLPIPPQSESKYRTDFGSEQDDRVLEHALCVLMGLVQVASSEQLEAWYDDRTGFGVADTRQARESSQSTPTCGGSFMVGLLLDLLEELQFDRWMSDKDSANLMSLSRLLSTGVLLNEGQPKQTTKKKTPTPSTSKEETNDKNSSSSPSSILPQWYHAVIAVLTQVGKTRDGMRILRARVLDNPDKSDWMGNALDVSIRQLHFLVLHLDDVRTRHGSILRLIESSGNQDSNSSSNGDYEYRDEILFGGDFDAASLLRSVEAWVRFWHQILLHAQSTESVNFRALVLDLQDWFTSTCATLMASEDIRQEIKVMIRWQMEELSMDEEESEDKKRLLGIE